MYDTTGEHRATQSGESASATAIRAAATGVKGTDATPRRARVPRPARPRPK